MERIFYDNDHQTSSRTVDYIKDIINRTGCELVISSKNQAKSVNFPNKVFNLSEFVVGTTPKIFGFNAIKGNAIQAWLDDNQSESIQYAILDDGSDMLLSQRDHFVHVNRSVGLTISNVEETIHILNCNELRPY